MLYILKRISPAFCGQVFGIASALTVAVLLVLMRVMLGAIIGVGEQIQAAVNPTDQFFENLFLGKALGVSLTILVPVFFCTGFVTGYVFAVAHNMLAMSHNTIRVKEGSFEFR